MIKSSTWICGMLLLRGLIFLPLILPLIDCIDFPSTTVEPTDDGDDVGLNHHSFKDSIRFFLTNSNFSISKVTCTNIKTRLNILKNHDSVCENLEPCTTYWAVVEIKNKETGKVQNKTIQVQTLYEEPYVTLVDVIPYQYNISVFWNATNRACIFEFNITATSDAGNTFQSKEQNDQDRIVIINLHPCSMHSILLQAYNINKTLIDCDNCTSEARTDYDDPGVVSSVTFEVVNEDTMKVIWKPPTHQTCINYYFLKWKTVQCLQSADDGDGDGDELCTWSQHNLTDPFAREYTINNLQGCEDYGLFISINSEHSENATVDVFTSPEQLPGAVSEVSLNPIKSTSAILSWFPPVQNPKCADHYKINLSGPLQMPLDQQWNIEKMVNMTNVEFSDLYPCGVYNVSITPMTAAYNSGPATNRNLTTLEDRPSQIENVTLDLQPYAIALHWDAPRFSALCIKEYRLSGWASDEATNPAYKFDKITNTTGVLIEKLVACQLYTIQIIPVTISSQDGDLTQIVTETLAIVAAAPKNPEGARFSHSLELETRDIDSSNKCQILFARFVCETENDVDLKSAEKVVEGRIDNVIFKALLEPLSPNTQYMCRVSLFNIAGWSPYSSALIATDIYYPEQPASVTVKSITTSKARIQWTEPKHTNGKLNLYQVYFQQMGPAYYVPPSCPNKREPGALTETSKRETDFVNMRPYTKYSVQVAATNDFGTGPFTAPLMMTTNIDVSEPVETFKVLSIDGPDPSLDVYSANVTLTWQLPCHSNGEIATFILRFDGNRSGHTPTVFERKVLPSVDSRGYVEHIETQLEPDFNYEVSIGVANQYVVPISPLKRLSFLAPAGIPERIDADGTAKVDAFESSNPTTSAVVKFPLKLLNSANGQILYAALLLSEKNCQPQPELVYDRLDSKTHWPNARSWVDVQSDACIAQYQTTPVRWQPVDAQNGDEESFVKFVIGTESCNKGTQKYCNGPLRQDTEYHLVIRLFTRSGYNDAAILEFKTDTLIRLYAILISVIGCLFLAFMAGFAYLWITKRIVWHRQSCQGIEDQTGDVITKHFELYYFEISKRDKLQREFKELQVIAIDLSVSASQANESKNRYTNIAPYDKNRVILDIDSEGSDYINASFINGYRHKKEYIATQGPKPDTFVDFWRMILQHNVRAIVMVTQFVEGEIVKCHQYFPSQSKTMKFGNYITVTCKKETIDEVYERRELLVAHSNEGFARTVVHYQFRKWPDHDCPADPLHLIQFVKKVKSEKISHHSPIVVHCSAGVGRTGTFIGLDIIMQRLKSEGKINIFEIVKELRFQRMKMVQTIQQYTFLYTCAYELILLKKNSSKFPFQKAKKKFGFGGGRELDILDFRLSDKSSSDCCSSTLTNGDNKISFNTNNAESIM